MSIENLIYSRFILILFLISFIYSCAQDTKVAIKNSAYKDLELKLRDSSENEIEIDISIGDTKTCIAKSILWGISGIWRYNNDISLQERSTDYGVPTRSSFEKDSYNIEIISYYSSIAPDNRFIGTWSNTYNSYKSFIFYNSNKCKEFYKYEKQSTDQASIRQWKVENGKLYLAYWQEFTTTSEGHDLRYWDDIGFFSFIDDSTVSFSAGEMSGWTIIKE